MEKSKFLSGWQKVTSIKLAIANGSPSHFLMRNYSKSIAHHTS
ncbi:hypothetical protein [Anabaena sp. FACHB-709]